MKIKYSQNNSFAPCPEYNGIARICDFTDLATYNTEFGMKEQFRVLLEIDEKKENGKRWVASTKPMSPSFHEKASLRKFTEKVLGKILSDAELAEGFELETLINKYCQVIIEHVQSGDKTFSNVTFVGKAKNPVPWDSDYVRLADRPDKKSKTPKVEVTADEVEADAIADAIEREEIQG